MLEVQNLSVTARNGTQLLKQISFQIEIGEAVGLTGQSGAGKTTLLKALLGILSGGCQVSGGTIQVDGQSLWALSPRKRRELCGTTLGFIPQNPMTAFDPRLKLGRQMEETLRLRTGVSGKEAVEQAEALLAELGLSQPRRVLDSYPAQLSGGMLQRAAAALLMALHPKYILADEPTSALDAENRTLLLELLEKQRETAGILFISHDVAALRALCGTVYVMEHGMLTEQGTMQELLEHPILAKLTLAHMGSLLPRSGMCPFIWSPAPLPPWWGSPAPGKAPWPACWSAWSPQIRGRSLWMERIPPAGALRTGENGVQNSRRSFRMPVGR